MFVKDYFKQKVAVRNILNAERVRDKGKIISGLITKQPSEPMLEYPPAGLCKQILCKFFLVFLECYWAHLTWKKNFEIQGNFSEFSLSKM